MLKNSSNYIKTAFIVDIIPQSYYLSNKIYIAQKSHDT